MNVAGSHRVGVVIAGVAAACLGATLSGNASTYASFSDYANVKVAAGAGVWAPGPPDACGPASSYRSIVWGTTGDDVIHGGNHPQIIMGLAGDDVITGGNSGDCLVGGPGNDRLVGGNAKDILIGGPGDDYLAGNNAKDALDGSEDVDVCDGGNGKDTIVNCEYDDPAELLATGQVAAPSAPAAHSTTSKGAVVGDAPPTAENEPATPGATTEQPTVTPTPDPQPAPGEAPGEAPSEGAIGPQPQQRAPADPPPADATDPGATDAG